jgi:hypothetical protein
MLLASTMAWLGAWLGASSPSTLSKPDAEQAGNTECDLCANDFLLVLATVRNAKAWPLTARLTAHRLPSIGVQGRSASTSLLETLNSLPGVNMRGENNAALWAAHDLYRRTVSEGLAPSSFAVSEHGKLSDRRLLCSLQQFFIDFDPPTRRLHGRPVRVHGFKELVLPRPMANFDKQRSEDVAHLPDEVCHTTDRSTPARPLRFWLCPAASAEDACVQHQKLSDANHIL